MCAGNYMASLLGLPILIKVAEQKEIKCHEIFTVDFCWLVSYVKSFRCRFISGSYYNTHRIWVKNEQRHQQQPTSASHPVNNNNFQL